MELRQLQFFVAVAETLNFHRAAQCVFITQPALSRQIRHLEEELGSQLFVRTPEGLHLTKNGLLLLPEARALIARATQLPKVVNSPNLPAKNEHRGSLKVGVSVAVAKYIHPVLVEYSKRFSEVRIQYEDIFARLANGTLHSRGLDVCFLRPDVIRIDSAQWESEKLLDVPFFVLLSEDSPLASRTKLTLKELAKERLLLPRRGVAAAAGLSVHVLDKILELYRIAGVKPQIVRTGTVSSGAGAALVATGKGIFLVLDNVSERYVGKGVAAVRLDEPSASTEVVMAWRKGETSLATLSFLKFARGAFCPQGPLVFTRPQAGPSPGSLGEL